MLRVGTVLHDTYRIDDFLSSGGFGNTYVATNIQFGECCAIKEFFLKGMTERDGNYFIGTFKNGNPSKGTWYDKHGKVSEVI